MVDLTAGKNDGGASHEVTNPAGSVVVITNFINHGNWFIIYQQVLVNLVAKFRRDTE
jgi:hypothetical protein